MTVKLDGPYLAFPLHTIGQQLLPDCAAGDVLILGIQHRERQAKRPRTVHDLFNGFYPRTPLNKRQIVRDLAGRNI